MVHPYEGSDCFQPLKFMVARSSNLFMNFRIKLFVGLNLSSVIIFVGDNFRRFFWKNDENFVILTDENYPH